MKALLTLSQFADLKVIVAIVKSSQIIYPGFTYYLYHTIVIVMLVRFGAKVRSRLIYKRENHTR